MFKESNKFEKFEKWKKKSTISPNVKPYLD